VPAKPSILEALVRRARRRALPREYDTAQRLDPLLQLGDLLSSAWYAARRSAWISVIGGHVAHVSTAVDMAAGVAAHASFLAAGVAAHAPFLAANRE
jgi:hypothetical protein